MPYYNRDPKRDHNLTTTHIVLFSIRRCNVVTFGNPKGTLVLTTNHLGSISHDNEGCRVNSCRDTVEGSKKSVAIGDTALNPKP